MKRSPYEVRLGLWLDRFALRPELEYRFAKEQRGRNWRLDFAWPDFKVGVEVDGGARLVRWQVNPYTGKQQPVAVGRHGQASDYEKMNVAAELGWRILRFNPEMMKRPDFVLAAITRTLNAAGASLPGSTASVAWARPADSSRRPAPVRVPRGSSPPRESGGGSPGQESR